MTDVTPTTPQEAEAAEETSGASAPVLGSTEATTTTETSAGSAAENPLVPSTEETEAPNPDAGRIPREVVTIDDTKEQGNRVTVATPNLETNPIQDLKDRITDHFGNASHIVSDLHALAEELDDLLNRVKAGL